MMEWGDVRIREAIAGDGVFAGRSSGQKYAQRRRWAGKIRGALQDLWGNFGTRLQPAQRRWPLSLFRVRNSGAGPAPAGRGPCRDFSVLNVYELDDRLL